MRFNNAGDTPGSPTSAACHHRKEGASTFLFRVRSLRPKSKWPYLSFTDGVGVMAGLTTDRGFLDETLMSTRAYLQLNTA